MPPSRLSVTDLEFSEHMDPEVLEFWEERTDDAQGAKLISWAEKSLSGFKTHQPYLEAVNGPIHGTVLELGAGHCWLTGYLSTLTSVEEVHAVEQSNRLLTQKAPTVIDYVDGNNEKIELYKGDYLNLKHFYGENFDFVFIDSAFHHTNHPIKLLHEIRQVLSDDGSVILYREPVLNPLKNILISLWQSPLRVFDDRHSRNRLNVNLREKAKELGYSSWGVENRYYLSDYVAIATVAGYTFDLAFGPSTDSSLLPFSKPLANLGNALPWQGKKLIGKFYPKYSIILTSNEKGQ